MKKDSVIPDNMPIFAKITIIMGNKAEKLLDALKKNLGKWTCGYCNSGSNQPAATFREIKKMGYVFEETAPNRWAKSIYCPICQTERSHYKLLHAEPLAEEKPRCTITPTQRKRVISLLEGRDAFSGAHITSTPEIDHKKPWSRLEQDIDISLLSDDEIKENFQLLTREHNLLKDRACQYCIKNNRRPPLFEIPFWYKGGEEYKGECFGCGWYDGNLWRKELTNYIKSYDTK